MTTNKVQTPAPDLTNVPGADAAKSDYVKMREFFATESKVRIRVPKDKGDQWVQVNGYTFVIQAGASVDVPSSIAALLENAQVI